MRPRTRPPASLARPTKSFPACSWLLLRRWHCACYCRESLECPQSRPSSRPMSLLVQIVQIEQCLAQIAVVSCKTLGHFRHGKRRRPTAHQLLDNFLGQVGRRCDLAEIRKSDRSVDRDQQPPTAAAAMTLQQPAAPAAQLLIAIDDHDRWRRLRAAAVEIAGRRRWPSCSSTSRACRPARSIDGLSVANRADLPAPWAPTIWPRQPFCCNRRTNVSASWPAEKRKGIAPGRTRFVQNGFSEGPWIMVTSKHARGRRSSEESSAKRITFAR